MRLFAMFLLTMLLAVPAWAAQVFEGKVVGISDGDTITVLTDQKQQIKVRLYGVDCPETKQAYGTRRVSLPATRSLESASVSRWLIRIIMAGR